MRIAKKKPKPKGEEQTLSGAFGDISTQISDSMRNNTEPPCAMLAKRKAKTTEQAPSADKVGPTGTPTYKRADASATGKASSKAKKAKLNKLQCKQK